MKLHHALFLPAFFCIASCATASAFSVNPITFALSAKQSNAVIQVKNQGISPLRLQADAFEWATDGANETLTATDTLILNAPIFTVDPGKTQYLRFGLRKPAPGVAEKAFRIMIEEVPTATPVLAGIHTLVRVSLPVFFAPMESQERLNWSITHRGDHSPDSTLEVRNDGNVHLKLHALRLLLGNSDQVVLSAGLTYVLPGQVQRWELPPSTTAAQHTYRLQLSTEDGSTERLLHSQPR